VHIARSRITNAPITFPFACVISSECGEFLLHVFTLKTRNHSAVTAGGRPRAAYSLVSDTLSNHRSMASASSAAATADAQLSSISPMVASSMVARSSCGSCTPRRSAFRSAGGTRSARATIAFVSAHSSPHSMSHRAPSTSRRALDVATSDSTMGAEEFGVFVVRAMTRPASTCTSARFSSATHAAQRAAAVR
jgi:hypothetical protein